MNTWPTKKLGDNDVRILVLAKAMFIRGCDFAQNKDEISRMLAIHVFDNVVEMILNLVAGGDKLPKDKRKINFYNLLEASRLDGTTKSQLSGLHDQRNPVQHHADIPDYETIIKYKAYTEDFLRDIFQNEFNISYDDVSLSLLIKDHELKELFSKAEKAFEEGNYKEAIEQSEKVLLKAVFDSANIFFKAGVLTGYFKTGDEFEKVIKNNYAEKYAGKDYYELAKEVSKAFLQLGQSATTMQFLGEYKTDFVEYRRRVENLDKIPDEKLKEEARHSLDFVINLLLKWQEERLL